MEIFLIVVLVMLFLMLAGICTMLYIIIKVMRYHDERLNRLEQPFNY